MAAEALVGCVLKDKAAAILASVCSLKDVPLTARIRPAEAMAAGERVESAPRARAVNLTARVWEERAASRHAVRANAVTTGAVASVVYAPQGGSALSMVSASMPTGASPTAMARPVAMTGAVAGVDPARQGRVVPLMGCAPTPSIVCPNVMGRSVVAMDVAAPVVIAPLVRAAPTTGCALTSLGVYRAARGASVAMTAVAVRVVNAPRA